MTATLVRSTDRASHRSHAGVSSSSADGPLPREILGYEIIDYIGEGAGSRLYVAAEPCTGQLFALKHVVRRREKDVRFFEQLENEYEVSRNFTHPNLRRGIHCKDNGGFLRRSTEAILLMELFDGTPLDNRAGDDPRGLMDLFIQTAAGLAAMHALGFIHCDLKPNNILVSPAAAPADRSRADQPPQAAGEGMVKIIDFGQACPAGTVKERIQGTPDFISPEQVRCAPVTPRTDVFNLGATMYWTLTRRCIPTLFTLSKGENSFLMDDRIAPPRELDNRIPEPLSNLVMECVRTNPTRRPPDMNELLRRLETVGHAVNKRVA